MLGFDGGCRAWADIFTPCAFYCGALSIWFAAQFFYTAEKV